MLAAACCAFLLGAAGCRTTPTVAAEPPPPVAPKHEVLSVPSYFVYEVRKGDTLYGLGERFGVAWQEIATTNGIGPPYGLDEGMPLLVPHAPGVAVPDLPAPRAVASVRRIAVPRSQLHRGKAASRYWWPTGGRLARRYEQRVRGLPEPGIGISAPRGTEVYAVASGTVITTVSAGGSPGSAWGNVVAVSHPGGVVSWYGQLDQVLVRKWRKVSQGDPIGTVGSSGAATRPELAFRMFRNDRFINPEDLLP
ncbi:MAG: hypothetical protein AMK73_01900 [Planctomycetes bacterium SM23_32]|nr:MAG: hypothetical protein AMK73_01900 [Planctomycetes bacterium SM23_32]